MKPDTTGPEEREEEILAETPAEELDTSATPNEAEAAASEPQSSDEDDAVDESGVEADADTAPDEADVTETPVAEAETPQAEAAEQAEPSDDEEPVAETVAEEVETPEKEADAEPAAEAEDAGEVEVAAESEPEAEAAEQAEPSDDAEPAEETVAEEVETPEKEADAEPAAEAEGASTDTTEEDDAAEGTIRRGDLIEATIIETSPTEIIVDLDDGHKGYITSRELERMGRKTLEQMQTGERVLVFVVNPNDHEGKTILSVNRAIEEMDWRNALRYQDSDDIYEGNVAGYNKGGLIVRFGRLRGFVPHSQLADDRQRSATGSTPEARFSDMVNDTIHVKVMEVDRSRNRLILSERAASREIRETRKEELIKELSVGEVREGTVVSLEDFGAFVDIGGAEGLVHLTEIAWKHVNHPREVLKVGQQVKVEVITIDPKRKRIGLSIKRQEADPWDEVATSYQVGDLVQATVTKLTKFGAFARLVEAEDIEGLIHISELSEERVAHPRDVVSESEKLTLRVVKIDVKNRRLGLSLKKVNSAEYLDRDLKTFASETDD